MDDTLTSDKNILAKANINKNHISFLVIASISLIFFQSVFVFCLLVLLDYLMSFLDLRFKLDVLFDFLPLGIITFAYVFSYKAGLLFIPFLVLNRIMLGKFEKRHLLKIPILALLAISADSFGSIDIIVLGTVLFIFRYAVEYVVDFILFREINLSRIPKRILHLIAAFFYFSTLAGAIIAFIK